MSGYSRWMERSFVSGTFPPQHIGVAIITGTGTVGQVLTCPPTGGQWLNNPSGYAFQWVRGYVPWTNIGTNANTYTLVAGDSGNPIRCVVTATNAAGSTTGPPSNIIMCA